MNRHTISILCILLKLTMILSERTARLEIVKTSGFLSIFKYSNFNVYFTPEFTSESGAGEELQATNYVWYIFGNFQSKFASKEFLIESNYTINGEEVDNDDLAELIESKNENSLSYNNFYFPDECKISIEASVEILLGGWKDNVLVLNFNYICMKDNQENNEANDNETDSIKAVAGKRNLHKKTSSQANEKRALSKGASLKNEVFNIKNPETGLKLVQKMAQNLVL